MRNFVSRRAAKVKPSPTLAVSAQAKAMKAAGIDVVGFGAGEPDFDTPNHIKKAAIDAIKKGFTKYTVASGIVELKDAVRKKFKRDQGLDYERNQVLVSVGGKHCLYNIFQAVLNGGDEVVIPAPYWVSYPDMAILAGAKPVIVPTTDKQNFLAKASDIEKAITKKTKMLIINSPSNPTGSAYSTAELKKIATLAKKHDLVVISDEIYEKIIYDGFKFFSIAQASKDAYARTVIVNGVSKTYSMTGWRIGYCAGAVEIIAAASKIQSQSTSNPTSFAQKGAVEALLGSQKDVTMMRKAFDKRRKYIVKRLNKMPSVTCYKPQGAFYVLPNFSGHIGKSYIKKEDGKRKKIKNDMDLAEFLLKEALVAVVPGSAFGAEGYLRLSYATSMELIEKGLDRIEESLKSLE